MQLNNYRKGFKAYLQLEKSLAKNSIDAYLADFDKLTQYLNLSNLDLAVKNITKEHLDGFLIYLYDLNVGPRTQARIISGIKAFYNYLILEDIVEVNPAVLLESPKIGRKLPEILNIDEIDQIIAQIDLSTKEGERNRAIIETLYSCGLRVSELTSLQLSNLYFEEGFILVRGKGDKERLVPIGKTAQKYIGFYFEQCRNHQKIKSGAEDIVFLNNRGAGLTRVMIFTMVKRLVEKAGINKVVSPHTFRHSFASHLVEGGADLRAVQDMLGHESITTTEVYTHLDRQYLTDAIIQFHPRVAK